MICIIFIKGIIMGKHKKKKREHSDSSERHSRSKSRSRDKGKKRSMSQEHQHDVKLSPNRQRIVNASLHQYYLTNESKTIALPYVVWNLCLKYAPRPQTVLIICESMPQVAAVSHAKKLNRSTIAIDQNESSVDLNELIKKGKYEVVIVTQRKCSILLALEEYRNLFSLIISTSKCFDTEFYLNLTEVSTQGALIVSFTDAVSSVKKLSDALEVEFQEVVDEVRPFELSKELINDIQLAPKPSNETIAELKQLSIPIEQIAARLFELELSRRQPKKSLHLLMPGYVTFKLDMDVQFNSLKYVWNFLREQFPKNLYESVKGMQKYENQKGVVFNIPEQIKYLTEVVIQKLRKHRPKFKGIDLSECTVLPLLEDTDSQEYKQLREKKKFAMENKSELQIFIGGVPYQMDENILRSFFKENNVNLYLVRILKDQKGFSKGIGFGLCENKEHFERAIKLNGSRIMDRTIRIKLADQRKD